MWLSHQKQLKNCNSSLTEFLQLIDSFMQFPNDTNFAYTIIHKFFILKTVI